MRKELYHETLSKKIIALIDNESKGKQSDTRDVFCALELARIAYIMSCEEHNKTKSTT